MSSTTRESAEATSAPAGNRRLFESLARRFYTRVYNYLCWISRDRHLAEDLTQETFMQIWQHPPEMRGHRALRAWVYRVARNQYLQHRRRAGLETVSLEDCREPEAAGPSDTESLLRLERDELRRLVQKALQELPDAYREVIVLHNLEGLSLAQVAHVLQAPVGTVKSRRAKAFRRLRELLQEVAP